MDQLTKLEYRRQIRYMYYNVKFIEIDYCTVVIKSTFVVLGNTINLFKGEES